MKTVKFYRSIAASKARGYALLTKRFASDFAISEGERAVAGMVSTEIVDRDGELMIATGADLANYEKNPIVLLNHSYGDLPVARCASLAKIAGKGLRAKLIFPTRPDGHTGEWPADVCFSLFQQGTLYGFSVGFTAERSAPTEAERLKYGAALRWVYRSWELLEISIATVPAKRVIYLRSSDSDDGPDDEPPRPARSMVLHRGAA